jgi:hypothetical protein
VREQHQKQCRSHRCVRKLLKYDANHDARSGIVRVIEEVFAINVVNVDVVGVIPFHRPRFIKSEPKAAVLEAGIPANQSGASNAKFVLAAKIGPEAIIWNSAAAPRA